MQSSDIFWVYMTAGSMEEARSIAKELVKSRLAACANLLPAMESIYEWENTIQQDQEVVLIAKTAGNRLAGLQNRVKEMHSYACPCVLALPVADGNQPFIQWIRSQVEPQAEPGN